ncbi:MAG: signal peptidase I [Solirubrobacteraceae bacterium]
MGAQTRKRKGFVANTVELVVTVAVAVGLALLVQAVLVKPYRIPSGSMIPTLEIGQRILVNRLDTHPGLGDVVVFHPPVGAEESGNGGYGLCANPKQGYGFPQACDQSTRQESNQTYVKRVVGLPRDRLVIRNGHVWLNGVEEKGSYVQSCPYPSQCTFPKPITVPAGEYYMMGDNRGISDDSRYWGPIKQSWIVGVAFATYWPIDRIGSL